MDLLVLFEKLRLGDDDRFNNSVIETVKIINLNFTKNERVENELLTHFQKKKYDKMLDSLWGVVMKELRTRINHLGLDAFNQGNGLGNTLSSERDLENLTLNGKLIDISSNMDALLPFAEMELRATQSQIELLKRKIKGELTYQQKKELMEILESAILFFNSPRLEKWEIGERFLFLVLNSDVADLYPILSVKLDLLNPDDLEQVAEKIFINYLDEEITLGQEKCIIFCFSTVWNLLPETYLKQLSKKVNAILNDCTENELVSGISLMKLIGALEYISGRNLERLLDSHFSNIENDLPFETPISTINLILDLKFYGVDCLSKKKYKVAAQVFLDFYLRYENANSPLSRGGIDIQEALDFIPVLIQLSKLEFLECLNNYLKRIEGINHDENAKEKLKILRMAVNRRKDFLELMREVWN
jgi:hypothetical protein